MKVRVTEKTSETDFRGDRRVILPMDYLQSAQAAAEIYEDELAELVTNLKVDNLGQTHGFLRGTLLATVLWAIPSVWTLCQ